MRHWSLSMLGAVPLFVAALVAVKAPAATPPPQPLRAPALASYALAAPDMNVVLPARLNEVSGVTALSAIEVACVQDEDGIVFVYDLARRRITREVRFGPPGDYEDIAAVGERLFVLRSDGVLFEIQDLSGSPRVTPHVLRLPGADIEGLCFDARSRELLVAPKTRVSRRKRLEDSATIFGFDVATGALRADPVLALSAEETRAFAERQDRTSSAARGKGGRKAGPRLRLLPSAIAVHPMTSEIFVLSAVDRGLATFESGGRVTGYAALAPALFRQPEGLTFLANGDMVVTNEASGRKPTLLLFKPRPSAAR